MEKNKCEETCTCGCKEGKECTCEETCSCGCEDECTCDENCECGCKKDKDKKEQ